MRINAIGAFNNPCSNAGKCCGPRKSNAMMPAKDNISFGSIPLTSRKAVKNALKDDDLFEILKKSVFNYIEKDGGGFRADIDFEHMVEQKTGKKIAKKFRKKRGLSKFWYLKIESYDSFRDQRVKDFAKLAKKFKEAGINAKPYEKVSEESGIPDIDDWGWPQ